MAESRLARGYMALAEAIDHRIGWTRLPKWLGIGVFVGLRDKMRQDNLKATESLAGPPPPEPPSCRTARTVEGTYNDLEQPRMGSVGCRFGRNVPLDVTKAGGLLSPSPRVVSRELMTRRRFLPADTLNVLAAAWLQFEVHDWFSHGKPMPVTEDPYEIPLAGGDDWQGPSPMRIQRTRPDDSWSSAEGIPPTFRSADTHWWDASQVYGTTPEWAKMLRTDDGRMLIGEGGVPPKQLLAHLDLADTPGAMWLGLFLLHVVFMREHNRIWEALREEYPSWGPDQLFDTARLINAALMAKIHTVEWTPGILAHPTTRLGAKINWSGIVGKRLKPYVNRLTRNEVLCGIPGSPTDHFGVPYSLTEEFVAVYRMHPLIPDDYTLAPVGGSSGRSLRFPDLNVLKMFDVLEEFSVEDCLYSLGHANPGAITLHNFPETLQAFQRPIDPAQYPDEVPLIDLAAIDILRNRERGVPRYNEFRKFFHRPPVRSFDEMTDNKEWVTEIRDVYNGVLDNVDLMVGLYAEPLPPGFGFSDTAFRVFILMATRRLQSDRFFTDDYRAEVYTPLGLRWIENTTFADVLRENFESLRPALAGVTNAFAPWGPVLQ